MERSLQIIEHVTGSSASPQTPASGSGNEERRDNTVPALKAYEGTNVILNEFQAVNVNKGKSYFDFTYQPAQDGSLTLNLVSVKSTLLGCEDSDVGIVFSLYRMGHDGKIDLSAYDGLGPAPTPVKMSVQYVVRATLILDRNCLGVAYSFGIQASR